MSRPMTAYAPQRGLFVGRPPCFHCGAAYRLHHKADDGTLACPTRWRPSSLRVAVDALEAARERGDQAALFAARGDIQHLLGRGHAADGCIGCEALGA